MNDESRHDEIALLSPINISSSSSGSSSNEQEFVNDSTAWQRTVTATPAMTERSFHERNRRNNNRAMMSELPLRLPIQKTLFECFLLYSFGITVELLFRLIGPPKLGYFCNDLSISFTSKSSIVNGFELAAFVYCASFFPILFTELYRLLKYDPEICFSMMERGYNKISRLAIRVVVFFGYCQVAIVLTWALTTVTKFSIGRPRPYFLWMCNSTYTCVSNYSTEYVSPDKYECQGNALFVQEARLSFFSGHSSLSLAAATYAVLYLQVRMPPKLFSRLLTPLFQFIIFASGLFVAYSRVVDHNHHPTDVLCGVFVGIVVAILVAKYVARLFDPSTEISLIKSSRSESSADESHIPPQITNRPSIQRQKFGTLTCGTDAWKPDVLNAGNNAVDVSSIKVRIAKTKKEVRGLLNKITPTTYSDLSVEMINKGVWRDEDTLPTVVELILIKAVEEPTFVGLYSDLCHSLHDSEQNMEKESFTRNRTKSVEARRLPRNMERNSKSLPPGGRKQIRTNITNFLFSKFGLWICYNFKHYGFITAANVFDGRWIRPPCLWVRMQPFADIEDEDAFLGDCGAYADGTINMFTGQFENVIEGGIHLCRRRVQNAILPCVPMMHYDHPKPEAPKKRPTYKELLKDFLKEKLKNPEEIFKLGRLAVDYQRAYGVEQYYESGVEDLLAAVRRDNRIIALISREKEGRGKMIALEESWEHMLQELSGIERKVLNLNDQVSKSERVIMDTEGKSLADFSRKDLETHLQRFDGIFNAVAMQVSELREKTGDTREQYLEWLRRIHGPYAPNPFKQKRLAKQKETAASILNEIGPIPTVDAVMQNRDVLEKSQIAQPQLGGVGTSAFGTSTFQQQQQPNSLFGSKQSTGNFFGAKPATASGFPFSNPAASNTTNSLFKPFGTPATTANATPSLFGTPSTSTAAQSQSTPDFGKTLSCSSSGTLFGGTASKQPFFGK